MHTYVDLGMDLQQPEPWGFESPVAHVECLASLYHHVAVVERDAKLAVHPPFLAPERHGAGHAESTLARRRGRIGPTDEVGVATGVDASPRLSIDEPVARAEAIDLDAHLARERVLSQLDPAFEASRGGVDRMHRGAACDPYL